MNSDRIRIREWSETERPWFESGPILSWAGAVTGTGGLPVLVGVEPAAALLTCLLHHLAMSVDGEGRT